MTAIVGVQRAQLMDVWPLVSRYFQSFAERSKGETTAGQLLADCAMGKRQCWLAIDGEKNVKACGLTEIASPSQTVIFNFCAGEGRHEWREQMVDEIERWAREAVGSRKVVIVCRPGWTKELKGMGYRETHRILERDLADGR